MSAMETNAYRVAERFVGLQEFPGTKDNPAVLAMLRLDADWPESDEVPWCSAFVNYVAWLLRLPRSKSLRARSWLEVGRPVEVPAVGFDVAILDREPDPLAGHVGFYAGAYDGFVYLLGGNQGNRVSVAGYEAARVLGYRRLA